MSPIPQSAAKAIAMRIVEHRAMESATATEFQFISRPPMDHWYPEIVPYRPPPAKGFRGQIHQSLGGRCGLCGGRIADARFTTFDHVVPRSLGGADHGNRIPAHASCNGAKGNRMPTACERIALMAVNARLGIGERFRLPGRRVTLAAVWPKR